MKPTHHKTKKIKPVLDSVGFYLTLAGCILIFIALLLDLPHLLSQQNANKARQEFAAKGLHVQGNELQDGKGKQVILHGVNRSGTEYQCVHGNGHIFDGPSDTTSIQAMKSWHINAVRVPLNEDCWLGINGANPAAKMYQQAIIDYVKLITQNNMYAIIDLHWNAPGTELAAGQKVMADKDHSLTFWANVANAFKYNTNVLFDLYNEPRNISWSCWKDGTGCNASFAIASMQDMINTVRATGANNVLLISGLDFSNDLSGWLANVPSDPVNNFAASLHMYGKNKCDNVNCWNKNIAPVMAEVPVIATEFGESYNSTVCGTHTSDDFMNWMDQHQSSYLAWAWDTWNTKCEDLSLITDYNGTPKYPNGTNYRTHLLRF